jgi:hypothetical protein
MSNNLSVVIGADVTGFNNAINNAHRTLDRYVNSTNRASREINNNCSVTSSQVESYRRVIRQLDRVNSGTMDTTQQTRALSNQVKELKIQFANLTDDAKRGEFGRSISASLRAAERQYSSLKDQIRSTSQTLNESNGTCVRAGGVIEELTSKVGLNIASFTKLGLAGAAVSGAIKVVNDSMHTNESTMDSLGIKIQQTQSVYQSFCTHLNTLDFSGFLDSIENVKKAARETYEAMDNLKTKGGIISNREAMHNAQRAKLEARINDKSLSNSERKQAQKALIALNKQQRSDKFETSKLNNDYVKAEIKSLLSPKFKEGTKEFDNAYKKVVNMLYNTNAKGGYVPTGKPTEAERFFGYKPKNGGGKKENLDDLVTDEFRDKLNPYIQAKWNAEADAYRTDRATNKQTQKSITSNAGKTTTVSKEESVNKSISDFFKELRKQAILNQNTIAPVGDIPIDYSSMATKPTDNRSELYQRNKKAFDDIQEQFNQGLIDEDTAERLVKTLNDQFQRNGIDLKFNLDTSDIEKVRNQIADTIDVIDDMGSSLSQLGSATGLPELDVAGMMAGAIASIVQGYGTATAQAGSLGPWAWIAFALAGAATMASVIAQINSLQSFASGGIIEGSNTVGDFNLARVNGGEMILNGTQQSRLFGLLDSNNAYDSGGSVNGNVSFEISGSKLYGVLRNYDKSMPNSKKL